jgi:hypothetical protein
VMMVAAKVAQALPAVIHAHMVTAPMTRGVLCSLRKAWQRSTNRSRTCVLLSSGPGTDDSRSTMPCVFVDSLLTSGSSSAPDGDVVYCRE